MEALKHKLQHRRKDENGPLTSDVEQSHSESVASLPLEGQSEEESLLYSVQEAQESGHSDPPPGAMKSQDSSHDVQTTTSAAPTKKRSSKSRENARGAKGTIRLTQVGTEEVKNVAQCSLVTSTGKVVTFKFSLDYDKPSELCRHLVRKGNGLLLYCIFRYQSTFCNSNFLFTFVCVCVCLSLYLSIHFICIHRLSMATSKAMRKRSSSSKLLMCCRRPSWRRRSPVLSCRPRNHLSPSQHHHQNRTLLKPKWLGPVSHQTSQDTKKSSPRLQRLKEVMLSIILPLPSRRF